MVTKEKIEQKMKELRIKTAETVKQRNFYQWELNQLGADKEDLQEQLEVIKDLERSNTDQPLLVDIHEQKFQIEQDEMLRRYKEARLIESR